MMTKNTRTRKLTTAAFVGMLSLGGLTACMDNGANSGAHSCKSGKGCKSAQGCKSGSGCKADNKCKSDHKCPTKK